MACTSLAVSHWAQRSGDHCPADTSAGALRPFVPVTTEKKSIASGLVLAFLGSIAFSGKAIIVKLAYRYGCLLYTSDAADE